MGTCSANFLASGVRVIDMVGFLSYFESSPRTAIKVPLKCSVFLIKLAVM